MQFPSIYLASNSPRRRELLTQIAVDFSVIKVDVDETRLQDEPAKNYVQRVALAKAQAGWDSLTQQDQRPVLGSDTSVVIDGHVLGKPVDDNNARTMLQQLSGQSHQVMTAVAIVADSKTWLDISISNVTFATLSSADIDWYIATQEGVDKAGSYAVQGLAAMFIDNIEGSYSGIMGLPLRHTAQLLQQVEVEL